MTLRQFHRLSLLAVIQNWLKKISDDMERRAISQLQFKFHPKYLLNPIITDANGSRVSIAIIHVWFCVWFCVFVILSVCPHDKTKMAETKSPNMTQGSSRYIAHQWILRQKVKGQGHRVTKCITSRRDSHAAPSRCSGVVAPRDGAARLSRRATTQPCTVHDCLIEGDRVVGVSYALYRVPSLYYQSVCLSTPNV